MTLADDLRYVRDELDSLATLRLMGPLDLELSRTYEALCSHEKELLEATMMLQPALSLAR
jgi:hypothetical protein